MPQKVWKITREVDKGSEGEALKGAYGQRQEQRSLSSEAALTRTEIKESSENERALDIKMVI